MTPNKTASAMTRPKLNRRSFFALLLAPFFARLLPKPSSFPDEDFTLSMDEFAAAYLRPAVIQWANECDAAIADYYKYSCSVGTGWMEGGHLFYRTNFTDPHLDPKRLPA